MTVKINDLSLAAVLSTMQLETDIGGSTANKITVSGLLTYVETNINIGTALEGGGTESILIDTSTGTGETYQQGGTAIGHNATAGDAVDVNADYCTAIGYNTLADVAKATAIGFGSQATGVNGVAIGDSAVAAGGKCVAIGNNCNVTGSATDNFSVGIGSTVDIDNDDCFAVGQNVTVTHDDCIVLGSGLSSEFANQFKFGNKYLELGNFTTAGLLDTATQGGHIVYNTDENELQVHDGSEWVSYARKYKTVSTTAGTTYTYVLADAGRYRRFTSGSAVTVTVPPNSTAAFPVGTVIDGIQAGAGQVTIAEGAGVTVNSSETLKIRQQYSSFSLIKVATDEWDLVGDLEETP